MCQKRDLTENTEKSKVITCPWEYLKLVQYRKCKTKSWPLDSEIHWVSKVQKKKKYHNFSLAILICAFVIFVIFLMFLFSFTLF